jgi:hypothetical protein
MRLKIWKKKLFFRKRKFFSRCKMRDENAYSNEIKCSRKDSEFYLLVITFGRGCSSIRGVCLCIRGMCSCIQRGVSLYSLFLKLNFLSMWISNHLTLCWDFSVVSFERMIMFNDISFFNSKWIISDLESSNLITFSRVYSNVFEIAWFNLSQLIWILFDDV